MNAKNDPNKIETRDERPPTPTTDADGVLDVERDELNKIDGGTAPVQIVLKNGHILKVGPSSGSDLIGGRSS